MQRAQQKKAIFEEYKTLKRHKTPKVLPWPKISEHFSQQVSCTLDLERSSQQENCTLNHLQLFVCTEDFSISLSGFELVS